MTKLQDLSTNTLRDLLAQHQEVQRLWVELSRSDETTLTNPTQHMRWGVKCQDARARMASLGFEENTPSYWINEISKQLLKRGEDI